MIRVVAKRYARALVELSEEKKITEKVRADLAAFAGALGRPDVANAWRRAQTPAPQAQPVFTPIRRNVGFFTMRGGTIGYVIDPGGVAVVDSQYPAEGKAWKGP